MWWPCDCMSIHEFCSLCNRCWCWSRILQTLPVPSPCGARLICLPPSAVLTMLSTVRHVDPPPPQHRSPLLPLLQVGGSSLRDYSISTSLWNSFKGSDFTFPFLWSIDHSYSHFKRLILLTSLCLYIKDMQWSWIMVEYMHL